MPNDIKLYINGKQIKNFKEVSGLDLDEDSVQYNLPDHVLLEEKGMEKIITDLDQEDAEGLSKILRGLDGDFLSNKRVRIFIQVLGPVPRTR